MKGLRFAAAALVLLLLCSCGKEIKNYRVHDDLVVSFTEALGERRLVSEKLTKSEDGKVIKQAEYTYKSDKPEEDSQSYLYYMLNNFGATFFDEQTVAVGSKTTDCAVIIKVSTTDDTFTINITRPNLLNSEENV